MREIGQKSEPFLRRVPEIMSEPSDKRVPEIMIGTLYTDGSLK